MIRVNIKQRLGHFVLDINTQIPSVGICAFFGRSGSGKTSIINAISGLSTPDEGYIEIDDLVIFDHKKKINVPPEQRNIGYVFQDARLFPHMNTKKNLLYGSKAKKLIHSEVLFNEVVQLLDLDHLLNRYPNQLSGGEKQRIAIGRALLAAPRLLLMDEPTAALDLPRKQELLSYLIKLVAKMQIPIIYVSHQLEEVLHLADHLLLIEKGEVRAKGSLYDVWNNTLLQPWFGTQTRSALVTVKLLAHDHQYKLTQVDLSGQNLWLPFVDKALGALLRLRIYAKDISIVKTHPTDSSIRNIFSVIIVAIEKKPDSSECLLSLKVGEHIVFANITCWAADELDIAVGDSIYAQLKNVCITKNDLFFLS